MHYLERRDLSDDDESEPVVDARPSPPKATEPESVSEQTANEAADALDFA
jgi:hypothetical protein